MSQRTRYHAAFYIPETTVTDVSRGSSGGAPIDVLYGVTPIYPSASIYLSPRLLPRFNPTSSTTGHRNSAANRDSISVGVTITDTATGNRCAVSSAVLITQGLVTDNPGSNLARNGTDTVVIGADDTPRGHRSSAPAGIIAGGVTLADNSTFSVAGSPSATVVIDVVIVDVGDGYAEAAPSDLLAFDRSITDTTSASGAGSPTSAVVYPASGSGPGKKSWYNLAFYLLVAPTVLYDKPTAGRSAATPDSLAGINTIIGDIANNGQIDGAQTDTLTIGGAAPSPITRRSWYHNSFYILPSVYVSDAVTGNPVGAPADTSTGYGRNLVDRPTGYVAGGPGDALAVDVTVTDITVFGDTSTGPNEAFITDLWITDDVCPGSRGSAIGDSLIVDEVLAELPWGNTGSVPTDVLDVYFIVTDTVSFGAPDAAPTDGVATGTDLTDTQTGNQTASPPETVSINRFVFDTPTGTTVGALPETLAVGVTQTTTATGQRGSSTLDAFLFDVNLTDAPTGHITGDPPDSTAVDRSIVSSPTTTRAGVPVNSVVFPIKDAGPGKKSWYNLAFYVSVAPTVVADIKTGNTAAAPGPSLTGINSGVSDIATSQHGAMTLDSVTIAVVAAATVPRNNWYHPSYYIPPSLYLFDIPFGNTTAGPADATVGTQTDTYDSPTGHSAGASGDSSTIDVTTSDTVSGNTCAATPNDLRIDNVIAGKPTGATNGTPAESLAIDTAIVDTPNGGRHTQSLDTVTIGAVFPDAGTGNTTASTPDFVFLGAVVTDQFTGNQATVSMDSVTLSFELSDYAIGDRTGSPVNKTVTGTTVTDVVSGNALAAPTGIIVYDVIRADKSSGNVAAATLDVASDGALILTDQLTGHNGTGSPPGVILVLISWPPRAVNAALTTANSATSGTVVTAGHATTAH